MPKIQLNKKLITHIVVWGIMLVFPYLMLLRGGSNGNHVSIPLPHVVTRWQQPPNQQLSTFW